MVYRIVLLLSLLCLKSALHAQDTTGVINTRLATSYINDVTSKADNIEHKLDSYTEKALDKVQKQELRIKRKLEKIDSSKAATIFKNAEQQFKRLKERLAKPSPLQKYIPSLDTMTSSLKFLQENQKLLTAAKDGQEKLKEAIAKVKGMERQFQKTEDVRKFLKERKQYLKDQLQNLGLAKELKRINKQTYYYFEQVNEYTILLKDQKKAERKVIELLSQSKMFKDFMRKNSMLASLFRLPGYNPTSSGTALLSGLQTRAQVSGIIQQQIATGGPNAQQQVQQNIQQAQDQFTQLKEKILRHDSWQMGDKSTDLEIPEGFKPNNQKTKSLWQRIELGTNIQSQKANGVLPGISDIGLSAGYKLNDKSTIGIGASYKVGLGQSIQNINITHQGAGLRSFVDWKIKGTFWISGGYEMNYRSEIQNVEELKDLDAWQQSGLLGLSKVVSLKSKFLKKTKMQLLWDFLSYEQVPRTQPIKFRIGYTIK